MPETNLCSSNLRYQEDNVPILQFKDHERNFKCINFSSLNLWLQDTFQVFVIWYLYRCYRDRSYIPTKNVIISVQEFKVMFYLTKESLIQLRDYRLLHLYLMYGFFQRQQNSQLITEYHICNKSFSCCGQWGCLNSHF